jgi:hypothetical protein
MIYGLINDNMKDEKKREQYLREFLPGTGLEDRHYKEVIFLCVILAKKISR